MHNPGFTEPPIRIASDGTVVAAVPLYVDPGTKQIGPGTVTLVITQGGFVSTPMTLDIQDLPSVASYGVRPGQISHVALDLSAMIFARHLNELQAIQLLSGSTVDTSEVQAVLKPLLAATVQAHIDISQITSNPSDSIFASIAADGAPISFDASSLDLMDRIIAIYLSQTFGMLVPQSTASAPLSEAVHASGVRQTDTTNLAKTFSELLMSLDTWNASGTIAGSGAALAKSQLGRNSTWSQVWDQATAGLGGLLSLQGTLSDSKGLGAYGAAISTANIALNAWVDDVKWGYAKISGNQYLADAAIQDMRQRTPEMIVGLASLVTAIPKIANAPLAIGVSAVAGFIGAAMDINKTLEAQSNLEESILSNQALSPNILELASDLDLSGVKPSVRQAGVDLHLGNSTTLNTLTDPNGNFDLFIPVAGPGIDYVDGSVQIVDPIGGQALGSSPVNLSNATANTQLPKFVANFPSEPAGWTSSLCQSTLSLLNGEIEGTIEVLQLGYSLNDPPLVQSATAWIQSDLSFERYLLNLDGCWVELDSIP